MLLTRNFWSGTFAGAEVRDVSRMIKPAPRGGTSIALHALPRRAIHGQTLWHFASDDSGRGLEIKTSVCNLGFGVLHAPSSPCNRMSEFLIGVFQNGVRET
jgi:hypothetical protein